MSSITLSDHAATIDTGNLGAYHRRSLQMAGQFGLGALLSRVALKDGHQAKISKRDDLSEYEGSISSIWAAVGKEHGEAHWVAATPYDRGYHMRCTCPFAAQTRVDTRTGSTSGNTCLHMMRVLYLLEPEILKTKAAEWKAEDATQAPILAILAARADDVEPMIDF